jgi:membrane associated rhomboid family serine protease
VALPIRDDEGTRGVPWVTLTLIALNVFVFLFLQPSGFQGGGIDRPESQGRYWRAQEQEAFLFRWGTVACEVTTGETLASRPDGCHERRNQPDQPPRGKSIALALVTAMFLHGSISHLAGNMLYLWVFGSAVEDRLGRWNYLGLYLLGGMVATLGYVAFNATSPTPLLGASGAIAVAMGAYLVLLPRGRILTIVSTAAFQVVYVPAAVVLLLFFVTQFFWDPSDNVAWEAHAAGMIVGFLATLVLARIPAVRARARERAADAELRTGTAF